MYIVCKENTDAWDRRIGNSGACDDRKKKGRKKETDRDPEIQRHRIRGKLSEKQPWEDKWVDFILFLKNKHLGANTASK